MGQGGPQEARWWLSRGPCDHPREAGAGVPGGTVQVSASQQDRHADPTCGFSQVYHRVLFCFVSISCIWGTTLRLDFRNLG